jgi:hypothetical protein
MPRWKPRSVASIDEAALFAACDAGPHRDRQLYTRTQSGRFIARPRGDSGFLAGAHPVPEIGRRQKVQGVRKLVTRKYPYVVYYTVDPDAAEIIVLSIQHPARKRDHEDD